jgi:TPR repeat protein
MHRSPTTNLPLSEARLIPNHALRSAVLDWTSGVACRKHLDALRLVALDAQDAAACTSALEAMRVAAAAAREDVPVLDRAKLHRLRAQLDTAALLTPTNEALLAQLHAAAAKRIAATRMEYARIHAVAEDCRQACIFFRRKVIAAKQALMLRVASDASGTVEAPSSPAINHCSVAAEATLLKDAFDEQLRQLDLSTADYDAKAAAVARKLAAVSVRVEEEEEAKDSTAAASSSSSSVASANKRRKTSSSSSSLSPPPSPSSTPPPPPSAARAHPSSSSFRPPSHVTGKTMFEKGWEYFCGSEFKHGDKPRGIALIAASACLEFPMAVAACMYYGWGGFTVDHARACQMFKAIAENEDGYHYALYSLGVSYYFGMGGLAQSYKDAYACYSQAVANGNTDHPYDYYTPKLAGQLEFERGWALCCGTEHKTKDLARGRRSIVEAARKFGFPLAIALCGMFQWDCESGDRGTESSSVSTGSKRRGTGISVRAQLDEIANGAHAIRHFAVVLQGVLTMMGGNEQSGGSDAKKAAFSLFVAAAEVGNALAMEWVGECYRYGEGVDADEAKACEWRGKAIAAGFVTTGQDGSSCSEWFSALQAAEEKV